MVEVNLLPQKDRRSSQPNLWKYATWALLPITALALLLPWMAVNKDTNALQDEIDALQGDINTLTPQKQKHDQLVARQTELEAVTKTASALRDQKTYWSNDLAAFGAQMAAASGVAIQSMTLRPIDETALATAQKTGIYVGKAIKRELELSGQATSQQAVINFLNTYEDSPNFGVNFKGMQRDAETDIYTFNASVGVVSELSKADQEAAAAATTAPADGNGQTAPGVTPAPASAPAAPAPSGSGT